MKKAALLLGGLILSAFVSGPAAAEVVRVRFTARVLQIDDASNALAGKVVNGQRVNGLYVYNTNTPNQSPAPNLGDYRPYANEGRVRVQIGSQVYESAQPTQGIRIRVQPQEFGYGNFHIDSEDNKPLADGTVVYHLSLDLQGTGNVTETIALPKVAPNLQNYTYARDVWVSAQAPQGYYAIRAIIESTELVVPDAIVVSPASGAFAANQHFDAAILLPRNSVVATMQATANGSWLPLAYPGTCQLQPQVGTGRPSLLCPVADQVINNHPGAPIEWTVTLSNGTVYTETVNWERAP